MSDRFGPQMGALAEAQARYAAALDAYVQAKAELDAEVAKMDAAFSQTATKCDGGR